MKHAMARLATLALVWLVGLFGSLDAHALSCQIVRVDAVFFGLYDPFYNGHTDSTGAVVFRCTDVQPTDSVVVELDRGGSGTFAPRKMSGGGWELAYNLYLDAARTVVWGDGTSGTGRYGPSLPPENEDVVVTIYGRVPSRQNLGASSYQDDLVVTLTY